ncbi:MULTISPECIES: hypothetical protein [Brachybacterium]|uniref:Uncharacterized protein n=2 Tax=Brachybacterium TaxID=43668 RepID=A0A426SJD4_9MICO|nr:MULTISPECIES: hypothetical protein [Brachybacterium]RRR18241.1 hypothetical protein DS079_10870 [Brachybacterium paraconglomeratum]GLI30347.1 hypothetical protein BCONGLO52_11880 [Brachybacterium conglomeratum]GLK04885.1 hypothetical protein GCM10017597_16850 [Brachybacterium conglomeratum]
MTGMDNLAIHTSGSWEGVTVARHVGGEWVPVLGGGGSYTPPEFTPDDGPVQNIATNTGVLQNQWTPGTTGAASATRHMLYANAAEITLGWFARPNPKFGAGADTPLRAWVRRPGEPWVECTFDGATEVSLHGAVSEEALLPSDAQNVYADPIPGPFYLGDTIEVMTWGQAATGTMGVQGDLDGTYDLGKTSGDPATVEQAPASAFSATGTGARPSVVLAPSAQSSSWALIGDSNSVNPARSYLAQAFRARALPHILNGKHGLGTYHLAEGWWDFQLGEQLKYADSVFSALGTNDGNSVGADLRANMVTAWETARAAGVVRWVQGTVAPRAIDNGDGTTSGVYKPGDVLNPWLRDGAPIIGGAPVTPGTAGAVRATVITLAGDVVPGDPAHPLGTGWVSDTGGVLESSVGSGEYRQDEPRVYNPGDLTHYVQAGQDIQAVLLGRDLALMGF